MLCVFRMYEVVRTLDQRAREKPKTVGVRLVFTPYYYPMCIMLNNGCAE